MDNTIEIKITGNIVSDKIKKLLKNTNKGLYERTEVVRLVYLALLSGESIFLLGPPGTAKSLLSRKMKNIIHDGKTFEYLMNPNTRQEELFGPIAISQLKHDKFVRVIDSYLPDSDVVFLDEIWKSESSILNSLLTIINEKTYKNGHDIINVPMKLLIAASNELPEEGVGLEALYDRFIIRYFVNNTSKKSSFESVILGNDTVQKVQNEVQKLTNEELNQFKSEAQSVKVPRDILNFIHEIKSEIADYKNAGDENDEEYIAYTAPYISDRRWKKIIKLLRTSALADGRDSVEISDLLIMPHVIWDTLPQKEVTDKIFFTLWNKFYISNWWFDFSKDVDRMHTVVGNCRVIDVPVKTQAHNIEWEIRTYQKFEIEKYGLNNVYPGYKYIWFEVEGGEIKPRKNALEEYEVVGIDNRMKSINTYDFYLTRGTKRPKDILTDKFSIEKNKDDEFFVNGLENNYGISFLIHTVKEEQVNISDKNMDEILKMGDTFKFLDKMPKNGKKLSVNPVLIDNYKQNSKKASTAYEKEKVRLIILFDEIKEKLKLSWL